MISKFNFSFDYRTTNFQQKQIVCYHMYSNWSIWPFSEPGFVYFHPQVIKSKHDCYDQLNHCSLIALSISFHWHPFPTWQFNVFFHVSLGKSIWYKEMFITSLMIGKILGEAWGILNLWRHKIWRGTDTDLCSSFFCKFYWVFADKTSTTEWKLIIQR